MPYSGRNRRRRFVYRTRNTEYHVFDQTCVAVRDLRSGGWLDHHTAVAKRLEGGARIFSNGAVVPTLKRPEVGHPFFFSVAMRERSEQLVTSRLLEVARPSLDDLDRYPGV